MRTRPEIPVDSPLAEKLRELGYDLIFRSEESRLGAPVSEPGRWGKATQSKQRLFVPQRLQSGILRNSSGSLAIFDAILRASSWVSNLTPARFDRAHSR